MILSDTSPLSAALIWLIASLPQTLAALGLLVAGLWLSGLVERMLLGLMDRQRAVDPTLRGVVCSGARYAVLLLFLIAAIGQLGFQMSSILTVLATAGLAIGLALQATLSNIAAGIMLLWLRPFKVGDQIEVGAMSGRVVEVGLFASEIHSGDGLYQFVPNAELWNKRLVNFSRLPRRLVSVRVRIASAEAIDSLRGWLRDDLAADPRILPDPGPDVVVTELADDKFTITLQAWTATQHHGAVLRQITDRLPGVIEAARAHA